MTVLVDCVLKQTAYQLIGELLCGCEVHFWAHQRSLGAVEVSSGVGGRAVFVTAEEDIQFTLLQVEGKCF